MGLKNIFLFLSLTLYCSLCTAQGNKVVLHFLDGGTNKPLNNVVLIRLSGATITTSDSSGYCVVPFDLFQGGNRAIAVCKGYVPDTLYKWAETVYLQPLQMALATATITSAKTKRVFSAPDDYVVDYEFAGDYIVAAMYKGNNGSKASLALLDKTGRVISHCPVPDEPLAVYRSCMGNCYCVCKNRFFPIMISGTGELSLRKPYPINMLAGLQQCAQSVNGNLYYKIGDKNNFRVTYGMIGKGDSMFRPFTEFEEKDVAKASYEELMEIIFLIETGHVNEASQMQGRRKMWDNVSYAHINMPLLIAGDSLVIFDFFRKKILVYNFSGAQTGSSDIHFDWRDSQHFSIIPDEPLAKIYIHRYANVNKQTVAELNIASGGESETKIALEKPLAEQVKVHDNAIYFLWHEGKSGGTRQLYVQHME